MRKHLPRLYTAAAITLVFLAGVVAGAAGALNSAALSAAMFGEGLFPGWAAHATATYVAVALSLLVLAAAIAFRPRV